MHNEMSRRVEIDSDQENTNAAFKAGLIGGALAGLVLLTPGIFHSIFGTGFSLGNGIH